MTYTPHTFNDRITPILSVLQFRLPRIIYSVSEPELQPKAKGRSIFNKFIENQ